MTKSATVLLLVLTAGPAWALQEADPVLQSKIDDAIRRGVEYLKKAESIVPWAEFGANSDELILLTLVHANVSSKDATYQALLQRILAVDLKRTYNVALQAMVLEEIDRVRYQDRIWQCAQFLLDNQCANGQWSYGDPTPAVQNMPTPVKAKEVASVPVSGARDFA